MHARIQCYPLHCTGIAKIPIQKCHLSIYHGVILQQNRFLTGFRFHGFDNQCSLASDENRKWLLLAAHHSCRRKWGGTGSDFKPSSELGLKSMFPGPCVPSPRSTLTLNPNPNTGNIEPWEHRALGAQNWPTLADAKENDAMGAAVWVQLDDIFALKEEYCTNTYNSFFSSLPSLARD